MNLLEWHKHMFVKEGRSVDETRKRPFLFFCIIICIPFVTMFAIDDVVAGRIYEGMFVMLVVAVFVGNLFALKYVDNLKILFRISGLLILATLSYELAIGGGDGYAFLWFYFFPLATFFLVGLKEGIYWVGLSILIAASIFLAPAFHAYGPGAGIRFLLTYTIVAVLSFGLEFSRNWYYRELMHEKLMLENALAEVKTLQGLLPICSFCKRIRDDKGYWNQIESYIHAHSQAKFTHGVCPECYEEHYSMYDTDEP